ELRQLVEAGSAQETARLCDARVVLDDAERVVGQPRRELERVLHHRPVLEHPERATPLAGALLCEDRRATAVDQDPDCDRREQRGEQDQEQGGDDPVADALDEPHLRTARYSSSWAAAERFHVSSLAARSAPS